MLSFLDNLVFGVALKLLEVLVIFKFHSFALDFHPFVISHPIFIHP